MAEFGVAAELEVTVSDRSLREARRDIEDELGDVAVGVDGGGGPGAGRGARADGGSAIDDAALLGVQEDQRDLLEDILDEVEGGVGGGGGAGGGGGGGGGALAGAAGAGAASSAGGLAGILAAGGLFQGFEFATGDRQEQALQNNLPGPLGGIAAGANRLFDLSGIMGPGAQLSAQQRTIEDANNFFDGGTGPSPTPQDPGFGRVDDGTTTPTTGTANPLNPGFGQVGGGGGTIGGSGARSAVENAIQSSTGAAGGGGGLNPFAGLDDAARIAGSVGRQLPGAALSGLGGGAGGLGAAADLLGDALGGGGGGGGAGGQQVRVEVQNNVSLGGRGLRQELEQSLSQQADDIAQQVQRNLSDAVPGF